MSTNGNARERFNVKKPRQQFQEHRETTQAGNLEIGMQEGRGKLATTPHPQRRGTGRLA
jgi:hypothetical protein